MGATPISLSISHLLVVFYLVLFANIAVGEVFDSENVLLSHLCIKVTQGRFDQINLKSFTYYTSLNGKTKLIIFEDVKKYYVEPDHDFQDKGTRLRLQSNYHDWNYDELREPTASKQLKGVVSDTNKLNAVYYLWSGDQDLPWFTYEGSVWKALWPWAEGSVHVDFVKNLVFLITDSYVHVVDIYNWGKWSIASRYYIGMPNKYPDFAIIQYHTFETPVQGYIIQRDLLAGTNAFIIHTLKVDFSQARLNVFEYVEEGEKAANEVFHYIELTSNPKEFLLVPRASRKKGESKREAQPFTKQPKGFRYKDDVYLFDGQWGCVYLLRNFAKYNLDEMASHSFRVERINIPFEKFFNCDKFPLTDMTALNASRCDKVWSSAPVDENVMPAMPRTHPPFWSWQDRSIAWLFLYLGIGLAVFIVVAIGIYYYWYIYKPANAERAPTLVKQFEGLVQSKKPATPTGPTPSTGEKTSSGKDKKTKKSKPKSKKSKVKSGEKKSKKSSTSSSGSETSSSQQKSSGFTPGEASKSAQ